MINELKDLKIEFEQLDTEFSVDNLLSSYFNSLFSFDSYFTITVVFASFVLLLLSIFDLLVLSLKFDSSYYKKILDSKLISSNSTKNSSSISLKLDTSNLYTRSSFFNLLLLKFKYFLSRFKRRDSFIISLRIVIIPILLLSSYLIYVIVNDKTSELKSSYVDKSMSVYTDYINNLKFNELPVLRLSKIGSNKYLLIYKNSENVIKEVVYTGSIQLDNSVSGAVYKFKYYGVPFDFKDTLLNSDILSDYDLSISYGINERIILLNPKFSYVLDGKSEYLDSIISN